MLAHVAAHADVAVHTDVAVHADVAKRTHVTKMWSNMAPNQYTPGIESGVLVSNDIYYYLLVLMGHMYKSQIYLLFFKMGLIIYF